jgi:hypothetical protein
MTAPRRLTRAPWQRRVAGLRGRHRMWLAMSTMTAGFARARRIRASVLRMSVVTLIVWWNACALRMMCAGAELSSGL